MDSSSPVHQWLKTQGYWKSGSSATHLFLDGGVACVPEDMMGTFNNMYAASVVRSGDVALFVVEKKPPAFRMFFDLDMRTDDVIEEDAILKFIQEVSKHVDDFFGFAEGEHVVVVCLSEPVRDVNKKWWKTGAHIIWPNAATVSPDALLCRDHVLQELRKTEQFSGWFRTPLDAVIDRSVLEKNGMRMIGSHKLVPCSPTCTSSCPKCRGRRKLIQRGVYWPRYTIRGRGAAPAPVKPIETLQDMRYWVSQTSLRVCPAQLSRRRYMSNVEEMDEESILKSSHQGVSLTKKSIEPHISVMLERFKDTLPPPFWTMRFTSMYMGGSDQDDPIFLTRTTSRYCLNLGRTHQSNNVYFLFSERGAYQMCFCRCQTIEGRKYGLCENFHSKAFPISSELKISLFGHRGTSKKEDNTRPVPGFGQKALDEQYNTLLANFYGARKKKKCKRNANL